MRIYWTVGIGLIDNASDEFLTRDLEKITDRDNFYSPCFFLYMYVI